MYSVLNFVGFGLAVLGFAVAHGGLSELAARRKLRWRQSGECEHGQYAREWRNFFFLRLLSGLMTATLTYFFWDKATHSTLPTALRCALIVIVVGGVVGTVAFGVYRTKVVLSPKHGLPEQPQQ